MIFRNGNEAYCSYDCIVAIIELLQINNYDLSNFYETLNLLSKKQLLSELNDENESFIEYLFYYLVGLKKVKYGLILSIM
ncbi:hypothetical protein B6F84_13540 [Acidianus manzaensis]|uniref:Uncharacterized protein n=1 Tax=Acidianus manzaensis TaxID=282676 RepID=A0A1W6K329_9CREN|nr:hypothetical protein B6F84_13540 [Acidianus manzaensis]